MSQEELNEQSITEQVPNEENQKELSKVSENIHDQQPADDPAQQFRETESVEASAITEQEKTSATTEQEETSATTEQEEASATTEQENIVELSTVNNVDNISSNESGYTLKDTTEKTELIVAGPSEGTITKAYGKIEEHSELSKFSIRRRKLDSFDVLIEIAYCGICHTDLHYLDNDLNISKFPLVPGHEISGYVKELGGDVKQFKIGQEVAVGCYVESCRKCNYCTHNIEQYCHEGVIFTYNSKYWRDENAYTMGGFSKYIVVNENYVLSVPTGYPLDKVGCLLCAGITVYSPLNRCKISVHSKLAVAGLGGLGHLALKLASTLGAEVWAISRDNKKKDLAIKYGAKGYVDNSTDESEINKMNFDIILDTISAKHDVNRLVKMLKNGGILCLIGLSSTDNAVNSIPLVTKGKSIMGSCLGSIQEARDLLKLCAERNILPETCEITIDQVAESLNKLRSGEIAHRYVINMNSL
ncbi:hypothetical protein GJ496_004707 [Pomphorhynchus laevis]|nr:hypothetical protein GJ496_004707 [Pomphorhynchus laevis]